MDIIYEISMNYIVHPQLMMHSKIFKFIEAAKQATPAPAANPFAKMWAEALAFECF